jgi:hypothetical protein
MEPWYNQIMNLIDELTKLEPVFIQAGQMAVKMQGAAKHHNKTNTGHNVVDIVTEADLAVQEFLLGEMAKTDLADCRLLAEEDTALTSKFAGKNGYYLAIDPIDGTAIYARGGKTFNTIISMHNGKSLLYTFEYFPILGWTQKIIEKTYSSIGVQPKFESSFADKGVILYYSGSPEKTIPDIYQNLTGKGLKFVNCIETLDDIQGQAMFICKQVAGFYIENPNAYDGLVALHASLATNRRIYSGGPGGHLDFANIQRRETGFYYPGYYLVLN